MILFTFSFDKRIQSHPAATPIKILHPTEIQTALTAPGIPVVLINGENANDKSVGAIVLLINEQIPNTPHDPYPALPDFSLPEQMHFPELLLQMRSSVQISGLKML